MCTTETHIRDGDLYEIAEVYGHRFEIRYGYYEEYERGRIEPLPIYPLFRETPAYSPEGYPLATKMQEPCEDYILKKEGIDNERCADCIYFHNEGKNIIGICKCEKKQKINTKGVDKND